MDRKPRVVLPATVIALISVMVTRAWMAVDPVTRIFAAETPKLANPSFEGEFVVRDSQEVVVGEGWEPWWIGRRPEYKEETHQTGEGRVYDGESAQKQFVVYSAHDAGLWQRIDGLEAGAWYSFSSWVYNWCSSQDDPDQSQGGKCYSMVGVNPWGNAWPADWTTIWGMAALDQYNKWVRVEVIFQAWSSSAILFMRGLGEWPVKHLDWYWDAARLEVTKPSGVCPTPVPCTPAPSGCASIEQIQEVIDNREPVRWPR